MSEVACEYYRQRANVLGITDVPAILDGRLRQLGFEEQPDPDALAGLLCTDFSAVEPYVLDGVRGVYRASGAPLTDEEWRQIRALPRSNGALKAAKFVRKYVVPDLLRGYPARGGGLYLEAFAPQEVPGSLFARATVLEQQLRAQPYESAQVCLLARTIDRTRRNVQAHLTVVWGEHNPSSRKKGTLTPRYLGALGIARELYDLAKLPEIEG